MHMTSRNLGDIYFSVPFTANSFGGLSPSLLGSTPVDRGKVERRKCESPT